MKIRFNNFPCIMCLVISLFSGCVTNTGNQSSDIVMHLKLAEETKETHNITLFMKKDFISGYAIPEELKVELNGSLRWKWYGSDHAPNACYIIDDGLDQDGKKSIDVGLAMLEYAGDHISGALLKWPDAGLRIDLDISDYQNVSGYSEWWGGPVIIVIGEDGDEIQRDNSDNKKKMVGKATIYHSIDECFDLINAIKI